MNTGSPSVIPPSELIVTERNTIYHLDLAPEYLGDYVIFVGDPHRVTLISQYFDKIVHKAQHREFITNTGYLGNKYISVISTGIGPDNIDIALNEVDALANIDLKTRTINEHKRQLSIIRLGTCGALQKEIEPDSLVVSSHAIGLDNLMHYYKFSNNPDETYILDEFQKHTGIAGKPVLPYIAEGAISLRKYFTQGYISGITATCPGFYGPQARSLRAPIAYPNLLDALASFNCHDLKIANFEMETSAIYGLGKVLGHKCLSISAVIANRASKTFSKDHPAAVDHMIKHSLEVISDIN